MKRQDSSPLTKLAALFVVIFLGLSATRAGADSKETYWTSVEGVTIWARATGVRGSTLLLVMRGREYRVPLSRLTPESVAKARRLLGSARRDIHGVLSENQSTSGSDDDRGVDSRSRG